MIKTTNSFISGHSTQQVLAMISQGRVSSNTAYRAMKLMKAVDKALKKISADYLEKIGKTFGALDVDGNPIPEPKAPHGFKLKEGVVEEEFQKAVEEFGRGEVEVDRWPLTLSDLGEIKLSALDLSNLGPFFADPEEMVAKD